MSETTLKISEMTPDSNLTGAGLFVGSTEIMGGG